MKNILALILFLVISANCFGEIKGLPFKDDQYGHAFTSAWACSIARQSGWGIPERAGLIIAASVVKEVYDLNVNAPYGFFSVDDIEAGLVGVAIDYLVAEFKIYGLDGVDFGANRIGVRVTI